MRTPKLAECEQSTLVKCVLELAAIGLEPDGRHAHLIPRWSKKLNSQECTYIIDWKGYVQLISRVGIIAHCDKVCANDVFEVDTGVIRHAIDPTKVRGAAYAYWAMAMHQDGRKQYEWMHRDEVDKIRARSQTGGDGPWATDYDEMAKKTVFRRLVKSLPISPEIRDVLEKDDEEYAPQVRNITPMTSLSDALADEIEGTLQRPAIEAEATPVETPQAAAEPQSKTLTQAYWKDRVVKATTVDELTSIDADAASMELPDALKSWVATQVAVGKKHLGAK